MRNVFDLRCMDAELAERNGPEEWRRILELRDHPRMLEGLYRYADLMPTYYDSNVMLNKVVTEAWRFQMLVYALHLYDTRDPADPTSGLTASNLTRLCARMGIASRGRVLAIIGVMRIAGYLERGRGRGRGRGDRRAVHLEPTDYFIGIVEGWNHRLLQIIDAIDTGHDLAAAHATDPRFGWNMRRRGAEALLAGWKILDPFPEVCHFVDSDGGWMLLLTFADAALRPSSGREIAPVSMDLAVFGKRFAVSRSHLRRLLESAYDKGLLTEPPRNGQTIVPSSRLLASYVACMASELGNYRIWAHQTLADTSRKPGAARLPRRARTA